VTENEILRENCVVIGVDVYGTSDGHRVVHRVGDPGAPLVQYRGIQACSFECGFHRIVRRFSRNDEVDLEIIEILAR
jgi:hypothetical protein